MRPNQLIQITADAADAKPAGANSARGEEAPTATIRGSALTLLLQHLGSKAAPGERVYEDLRGRLILFFQLHVPAEAEALADETFDRLARKLEAGEVFLDARQYLLGIARMLLLETRTRLARQQQAADDPSRADEHDEARSLRKERVFAALADCLQQLGPRSERLILAYYAEEGGSHIRARRTLAQDFGISLNALQNRALRLRQTLERCVSQRLQQS